MKKWALSFLTLLLNSCFEVKTTTNKEGLDLGLQNSSSSATSSQSSSASSSSVTASSPSTNSIVGARIRLIRTANVRSSAGILSTNLLGTQPIGALGTVTVAQPQTSDSITWFTVNFDTGVDGIIGNDNFELYDAAAFSSLSSSSSSFSTSSTSFVERVFIGARGAAFALPKTASGDPRYKTDKYDIVFGGGATLMNTTVSSYYAGDTSYGSKDVNAETMNYLVSNVTVDGQTSVTGNDLVEIKPFYKPIGHMVFKNVVLKNTSINDAAAHTDLIQVIVNFPEKVAVNRPLTGWFVIQDSVIKDGVQNGMIMDAGGFKGTLYQNIWVDAGRNKGDPNSWIARECAKLIANGLLPHCNGNNSISASGSWNNPTPAPILWLVNVTAPPNSDNGKFVIFASPNGSTNVADWGVVIIVESDAKKREAMYINAGKDSSTNKVFYRSSEADKVYKFADIESALARFPNYRPPLIETSCSGWKVPPAGCLSGAGPMGTNEW